MKSFVVVLQDAVGSETFDEVVSFVGEDASGSFGIQAGHARIMTVLVAGLARFRRQDGAWRYVALPGALLYFAGGTLTLAARRYVLGDDYSKISELLETQLLTEERELDSIKQGLQQMEEQLLKRLWNLERRYAP